MVGKEYMEEVLDYIEQHITQPFNVQELPVSKYLSTMQLYRDFYNLTGHTVKEYIRKRRLSNSLAMVRHSDKSLVEIAYAYGYSSQQAFCKCVKKATGLTPTEYKLNEGYYYYPRFCYEHKYQILVTLENIPKTINMKFYHGQLRGIENRSIGYLFSILPGYMGRIFGRNSKQLGSRFCYELNIEYSEGSINLLKNSDFREVNICSSYTNTFAKTTVKNLEKDINLAWDYLYLEWLKLSMFEQSAHSYFEEYICNNAIIKRLVLYLPVNKREDYNKIWIRECEDMYFLVSSAGGSDGEEKASKQVMDYLLNYNPYIIHNVNKFYVSSYSGIFTCGVTTGKDIIIKTNNQVELLHINHGKFVVIEGDCYEDGNIYERILGAWILDNGFNKDASPGFTVYETDDSYEQKNIKTVVYHRLE
ncbi:MAG: hypothetical protein K0S61_823 [Anaerocolumna sp.]|jgi:AraC-like DNA-binding protein/DNA gyrase inhibitor GyrI|nr:hypothetical protein [Anaerocolumna sp.]